MGEPSQPNKLVREGHLAGGPSVGTLVRAVGSKPQESWTLKTLWARCFENPLIQMLPKKHTAAPVIPRLRLASHPRLAAVDGALVPLEEAAPAAQALQGARLRRLRSRQSAQMPSGFPWEKRASNFLVG